MNWEQYTEDYDRLLLWYVYTVHMWMWAVWMHVVYLSHRTYHDGDVSECVPDIVHFLFLFSTNLLMPNEVKYIAEARVGSLPMRAIVNSETNAI